MPFRSIQSPEDKNVLKAIKELQGSLEDLKESSDKSNNSMIQLTRILVILTILLCWPIIEAITDHFAK
ncbi:MAG: hypothetical protein PHI66_00630 [Candidatus Pacebacteria bacterium]|nr:hypothetical protein [Candidatus Paceibacterota bacterium]